MQLVHDIDDKYIAALKKHESFMEILSEQVAEDIKIVYTPFTWNR